MATADERLDPHGFDADTAQKTTEQRLTDLENALFGDRAAIAKYEQAVATYVVPRGVRPPDGLLPTMQRQVGEAVGRFAALQKELEELRAIKGQLDDLRKRMPSDAQFLTGDGDRLATRGFVDAGLERLSKALRDEFKRLDPGIDASKLRGELELYRDLAQGTQTALRDLAQFLVHAAPRKFRRRIVELLGRWQAFEKAEWIFKEMAAQLGDPELRR